jgi:hypothetical protein
MRIVRALHWLKDTLGTDRDRIVARLSSILEDSKHGKVLRDDLRAGLHTLPVWMQEIVRELLDPDRERQPLLQRRRAPASGRPPRRVQSARP